MSIELTTTELGSTDVLFDNIFEQGIDCDLTLPDYCPDIMRILKCTVINSITGSKITGDRASTDGNAKIRIMYADEKNSVCSYEQDYPFSKYAELPASFDSSVLCVDAKTEYINCRAVSKKRIDIHGVIGIHFRILGIKKTAIITDANGDGIQLRKKEIHTDSILACLSKKFQLSETETIGENSAEIGKIINAFVSPVLTETKIIKGKLLIKGEAVFQITYCAEGSENEGACVCYSLHFSEIAESESIAENSHVNISLNVNQMQAEPKTDNDGEYKYFNLGCELCANIIVYSTDSVSVITDAYSTQKEIDIKYQSYSFSQTLQSLTDSFVCRENLDLASMEPQRIFATIPDVPNTTSRIEAGKLVFKGNIPIKLILIAADGSPVFCERDAEFEYSRSLDFPEDNIKCTPQISLTGYTCVLGNDGKAEFKAELNIHATVTQLCECRTPTSLQISESPAPHKRNPSLVIRYCDGGEKIWDIARKYNTTVEDIMNENDLPGDEITEKMMLVIPVK